jgi:hypothetical protein
LNPARTPSSKQGIFPNKANFYSVGGQKTKPIQSQTNPILNQNKAYLNPNLCKSVDSTRGDSTQGEAEGHRLQPEGQGRQSVDEPLPHSNGPNPVWTPAVRHQCESKQIKAKQGQKNEPAPSIEIQPCSLCKFDKAERSETSWPT